MKYSRGFIAALLLTLTFRVKNVNLTTRFRHHDRNAVVVQKKN